MKSNNSTSTFNPFAINCKLSRHAFSSSIKGPLASIVYFDLSINGGQQPKKVQFTEATLHCIIALPNSKANYFVIFKGKKFKNGFEYFYPKNIVLNL